MEQQNQYIKQFPELMKGKKILYVHGFGSSGQSGTVSRIREVLPNTVVVAPDLPIHPQEAIDLLRKVCAEEQPDLIIGTSMGGMYAEMLYGYDRILVNPALQMGDTMKEHGMIGAQHFSNPRQDGVQDFIVTKALVKEYKEMTEQCFTGITPEERGRVWGLFGDEDTTVNTYDLFRSQYSRAISFHGEHRMNDKSFMHSVLPVIRWIDDRQEGRERPIIYIGTETLSDIYEAPRSSVQKTVRWLIEHYQVFFVAAAPADAVYYADVNEWLYDYINVPAWGHTVFTVRRDLLYGDYFIGMEDSWAGMATHIQFGSDTFKTWDDIAEYFSRLGGQ
ncbi:MAG: esterase [Prevotella sp.]|nr:esterase [Prevotella sp.]